jgi:hypothetical protein
MKTLVQHMFNHYFNQIIGKWCVRTYGSSGRFI